MHYFRKFLKPLEQPIFKQASHVMMDFLRESKARNKVIDDLVCSRNSGFIPRRACLSKLGEMIYNNEYVFIAPELRSRCTKSIETIFKGAVVIIGCNGSLVIKLGYLRSRQQHV